MRFNAERVKDKKSDAIRFWTASFALGRSFAPVQFVVSGERPGIRLNSSVGGSSWSVFRGRSLWGRRGLGRLRYRRGAPAVGRGWIPGSGGYCRSEERRVG